jgi:hypothetical protein
MTVPDIPIFEREMVYSQPTIEQLEILGNNLFFVLSFIHFHWCCVGPCLFGPGRVGLGTMLLSWVFFFPQWGLGVCVVLWSVGCKSIHFLVHSFIHSVGTEQHVPQANTSRPQQTYPAQHELILFLPQPC